MNKTFLVSLLWLCTISTQTKAQSAIEETSNTSTSKVHANAQQKKHVSSKDYKLWETIGSYYLSDNGEWYTYIKRKKNERTLFLGATKSALKYNFPNGGGQKFNLGSKWFACSAKEKGLGLLNLETKEDIQWISSVSKFEFSLDGNYLIYTKTNETNTSKVSSLIILDLKTGKTITVAEDIKEYALSPNSNQLAYIQDTDDKKTVKLISLGQIETTNITENNLNSYKSLVWNVEGTALAFLQEQKGVIEGQDTYKIYCYKTIKDKSKLYSLDTVTDDAVFPERNIININNFKLRFSPKGSVLYFKVHGSEDRSKSIINLKDNVEVWKAIDKELYPGKQQSNIYGAKLTSWNPENGKTAVLETNSLPKTMVGNNERYMLSYDPLLYEPSFAVYGKYDLYLTDLKTGASHLFLKEYGGKTFISPNSNYVNYFRDKHWWVYDLEKKTHTNITKHLAVTWHNNASIHPHKNGLKPFGTAGWTKGDKQLIVYDKYDVWLISPTGESQRLTKGRSSQIQHRIYGNSSLYRGQIKSHGSGTTLKAIGIAEEINLSEGLTFQTEGADKSSGYSVWKPGKKTEVLVYKQMYVNNLIKAYNKKVYIYKEQSFKTAPRIMYLNKKSSNTKILEASNTHQKQFHWGRSELVYYKGPKGEDLQGALFYPANYKPGEKYPMIVEIYERMSGNLHKYQNPTKYPRARLNRTNYSLDGYFIFHPDISYTYNNVGMSAVHCVEAGVKAVIAKGIVNANHIGLNGHSFGGYETNFIITKSHLFATAVAGSSVSDVVSMYHFGDNKNNMKNFEDWQFVFKGSFYENQEAYLRNSPIHHLAKVNTPLLLWAGKKDASVDYRQSFEMYYGLRRLNKTCELLLYPNEGHEMNKAKNKMDLARRTRVWFDKYLKLDRALKND